MSTIHSLTFTGTKAEGDAPALCLKFHADGDADLAASSDCWVLSSAQHWS